MTAAVETRAPFATVEEAIEDIRQGRFVVVVDAEDRENEGDLTIAAQFATPEAINFMATHARGLICLCLTEERCDELGLEQMARENETPLGTAFTVSVEAREGVTTGISARGPLAHDPGRDRPVEGRARPGPSRTRLSASRAGRWCARAVRANGSGRRSRAPRGAQSRRRRLRDHERGRDDGARPGSDRVLRAARDQAADDRRPDRVSPRDGEARRARRAGAVADRVRRVHRNRVSARR